MKEILINIGDIPKNAIKIAIKIYQFLFSFDHSFWSRPEKIRICIYYPSCSQYTLEAVDKHGAIMGSIMGMFRIMRCNGMAKGGLDPVPDHFSIHRSPSKH